jgi:hypothetical protein
MMESEVVFLPVAEIKPSFYNPRCLDDRDEGMDDLIASIREHGILQPVVVVPGEDGMYEIVMGERRWRAAVALRWTDIPCIVQKRKEDGAGTGSDVSVLRRRVVQQVIENTHRVGLGIFDEARGLRMAWIIENLSAVGRDDVIADAMYAAQEMEPYPGMAPEVWQKIAFGMCLDERAWEIMHPVPPVSMKEFLERNGIAIRPDTMRKKLDLLRMPLDRQLWAMRHQVKTPGLRAMMSLPPIMQQVLQMMADREVDHRKKSGEKTPVSMITQKLRTIRNSIVQHRRSIGVSTLIVLGVFPNTPQAKEWIDALKMEDTVMVGDATVRIYDLSLALFPERYPELKEDDDGEVEGEDDGEDNANDGKKTTHGGKEINGEDEQEEDSGTEASIGSGGGDREEPRGIGGGLFGRPGSGGGDREEPRGIGGGLFGRPGSGGGDREEGNDSEIQQEDNGEIGGIVGDEDREGWSSDKGDGREIDTVLQNIRDIYRMIPPSMRSVFMEELGAMIHRWRDTGVIEPESYDR